MLSSKTLVINQTFLFDIDQGSIGNSPGADVWFEAQTATQLFLTPRNGALLAVGDRSNRGYDGCASENYSNNKVPLGVVPPGSYICALTSDGNVSQIRINGITPGSPKKLTIGYTTWQ